MIRIIAVMMERMMKRRTCHQHQQDEHLQNKRHCQN